METLNGNCQIYLYQTKSLLSVAQILELFFKSQFLNYVQLRCYTWFGCWNCPVQ